MGVRMVCSSTIALRGCEGFTWAVLDNCVSTYDPCSGHSGSQVINQQKHMASIPLTPTCLDVNNFALWIVHLYAHEPAYGWMNGGKGKGQFYKRGRRPRYYTQYTSLTVIDKHKNDSGEGVISESTPISSSLSQFWVPSASCIFLHLALICSLTYLSSTFSHL